MARILIADDDNALRTGLARTLVKAGHVVEEASNGALAIARLRDHCFHVVLTDLRMAGGDGLEVLKTTKTVHPKTPVILMTGFASVTTAVEAMKLGAVDYLQKPFSPEGLTAAIAIAIEKTSLDTKGEKAHEVQPESYNFDRIVGESPALRQVLDTVRKVAKSNATVLILGETGTGKELIAGAVHYNSLRASRNYVKVNCAALQQELLESELFGHERGAFTGADGRRIGRFELANQGTLFLDEIGDMSPATQAKILRVLQEREFERLGGNQTIHTDVRLIAATNVDLARAVRAGRFREDLFYRLNVVTVTLPALRARRDDILPLARFFMQQFAAELHVRLDGFDAEGENLLLRYNWPGNIRELANAVERAVLVAPGHTITSRDLTLGDQSADSLNGPLSLVKLPPDGIRLDDLERNAIIEALRMSQWVQKDAATLLSISPRVMHYKINRLAIKLPKRRVRKHTHGMADQPSSEGLDSHGGGADTADSQADSAGDAAEPFLIDDDS